MIDPVIFTRGGVYVDLTAPDLREVGVSDVGHALAHLCRFGGHCVSFYSVAQHSCLVADLVPPRLRAAALFHDAAEAFVGDMIAPLKSLLPEYREIEAGVGRAVAARFGVPWPMPDEVKRADLVALAMERRDLLPADDERWSLLDGVEPAPSRVRPVGPARARDMFVSAAKWLGVR